MVRFAPHRRSDATQALLEFFQRELLHLECRWAPEVHQRAEYLRLGTDSVVRPLRRARLARQLPLVDARGSRPQASARAQTGAEVRSPSFAS